MANYEITTTGQTNADIQGSLTTEEGVEDVNGSVSGAQGLDCTIE